jgi:hypothetical protein
MMVTEFITGPIGEKSHKIDENTKRIFNILGDKPETVARYLAAEMLKNKKNGSHIVWLSRSKLLYRFARSRFVKRDLFVT